MGATKLMTAAGGGITLDAASTASDKTITVPADNGTLVYANSSGNVGIGTSSPSQELHIYRSSGATDILIEQASSGNAYLHTKNTSREYAVGTRTDALAFYDITADAERARITSAGEFLVGLTTYISGQSGSTLQATTSANNQTAVIQNTHASSPYGLLVMYPSAAPNNGSNEFLYCKDSSTTRAYIRSNGGLSNYSANNTNLSDERTKTDIVDAGNYLEKICAIPVRTFKYKDQTDDLLNLGVIAQEVEAVAPELVDVSGFGETPEDGVPLKSIYQTDLQYALMKCIQELKAELDAAKADIAALKGQA